MHTHPKFVPVTAVGPLLRGRSGGTRPLRVRTYAHNARTHTYTQHATKHMQTKGTRLQLYNTEPQSTRTRLQHENNNTLSTYIPPHTHLLPRTLALTIVPRFTPCAGAAAVGAARVTSKWRNKCARIVRISICIYQIAHISYHRAHAHAYTESSHRGGQWTWPHLGEILADAVAWGKREWAVAWRRWVVCEKHTTQRHDRIKKL